MSRMPLERGLSSELDPKHLDSFLASHLLDPVTFQDQLSHGGCILAALQHGGHDVPIVVFL